MPKQPDFFVDCYDNVSSTLKESDISDFFALCVTDRKLIDGGINKGGKEILSVIMKTCGNIEGTEATLTLTRDSFYLEKLVNSGEGRGYAVRFIGKQEGNLPFYTGNFSLIFSSGTRSVPTQEYVFRTSARYFFEKSGINLQ